ncbi:hypothetical protein Barb7_01780 [Bacteroidales bacterium Barb7]|nr:hypothetical protein Barb7_01780 [Bacteroidales bacterium Barb7]
MAIDNVPHKCHSAVLSELLGNRFITPYSASLHVRLKSLVPSGHPTNSLALYYSYSCTSSTSPVHRFPDGVKV